MGAGTALVRAPGTVLLASTAQLPTSGRSVALPPDSAVWLAED
jgi:alpha-glucosidase